MQSHSHINGSVISRQFTCTNVHVHAHVCTMYIVHTCMYVVHILYMYNVHVHVHVYPCKVLAISGASALTVEVSKELLTDQSQEWSNVQLQL